MTSPRALARRLVTVADAPGGVVEHAPPVALRALLRRFWPYARPYRGWLALLLALIAAAAAIDTVVVWLFKLVVDRVMVPGDFGAFAPLAGAFLGLTALGGAVSFLDDWLSTWVEQRFLLALRSDLFAHLQRLSPTALERRRLGDVLARLTGDVAAIESLLVSGAADVVANLTHIAFFGAALFLLQWDLALVALVVGPLFFLTARRFARLVRRAAREKRRRTGSIGAVAEESLANLPLVQAYGREDAERARYERENRAAFAASMASTRIKALFTPLVDLIEVAGALLVIAYGTLKLSQGALTLGGLLVFLTYLGSLYRPVRGLSKLSGTFYAASAGAERIAELLDEEPGVREHPAPVPLGRARGEVRFRAVTFTYPGAARPALEDVSLALEPGTSVALVGASGAGKSTLAKLLLRFHDPQAGAVSLDGLDLRDVALADLRRNVAVLLQETLVFDGSVRENVAFGRPHATQAEIEAAARAADAHDFILELPDGYDARVGQRGRRLSGGQRQRLAIARALIRCAPVLVLDEPTTGLDAEAAARVMEPLRRLMDGRATLIVSHDLLLARDATEIVVLDGGRVAERGTHAELLARGGRYAALHRVFAPPALELPA
jgi:ABC-type multidrug transport system fused ATPase/permease subunit